MNLIPLHPAFGSGQRDRVAVAQTRCLEGVILDVNPGILFAGVGPSAGPFDLMSAHAFFLQAMLIPPHAPQGVILDVNTCILFAGDGHSATRLRVQAMIVPPFANP